MCIQQFIECDTGQSSKTEGVGECKKLTEIEEVSFELQSEEEVPSQTLKTNLDSVWIAMGL